MRSSLSHFRNKRVLAVVMAVAIVGVSYGALRWGPNAWLVAHWRRQIPTLSEEALTPAFRQLLSLGDDQIDYVVAALASDQERIARSSRLALAEELPRWKLLRSSESSPKVARLAQALAEWSPHLRGKNQDFAADVAIKLLAWPIDRQAVAAPRLIHHCEVVLHETAQSPSISPTTAGATALPLVALPPAPLGAPNGTAPETVAPIVNNNSDDPSRSFSSEPAPLNTDRPNVNTLRPSSTDLPLEGVPPRALASISDAEDAPPDSAIVADAEWPSVDVREVMRQLRAPDTLTAAKAMREFRRRGFGEVHVPLAERLLSPNSRHRRELADLLPTLPDLDPRPWLLWLSEDDSPEVRLAAVSIMATSSDPSLKKRLRQMELDEGNAAVLQQLRRLLR